MSERPIRVLIAKPGLDGHDVGARAVSRALMDAGMEVTYTGLRQSPEAIAAAARAMEADAVGLSILSGAHLVLTRKVAAALERAGLDVLLVVGGNVPARDHEALSALGVDAVFAVGTPFDTIARFIEENARR